MRAVKEAIHTYLESKVDHCEINEPRKGSLRRYATSKASSLYSLDNASSNASSVFSFSTCHETTERASSDNLTLVGSGNWDTASSAGTSLLTLALLPLTCMEIIQIPPSLLGPGVMNEEQYWSDLAPTLPTSSPAPYNSFKERYLSIFPYLWLHGRLWHGDRAVFGTLLITRYSSQSGKIELSKVELVRSSEMTSWPGTSLYLKAEATVSVQDPILGLSLQGDPIPLLHRNTQSGHLFHRIVAEQPSSSTTSGIWPPILFPATDRTTRASGQRTMPSERPEYSLNLFGLSKTDPGLDRFTGSHVELFAALDPQLYKPDIEHPLRGIWYWRSQTRYEFMLFHQLRRNHLEGLKLTGNPGVARGNKSIEFDGIDGQIKNGVVHTGRSPFNCTHFLETPVVHEKSGSPDRVTYGKRSDVEVCHRVGQF